VTTHVSNLHPDGILLKFRYPKQLSYVDGTAVLRVNDSKAEITPIDNVVAGSVSYLVFHLTQANIGPDSDGTIAFELKAERGNVDGSIDVDPTIVDTSQPVTSQFNPDNPEFGAKDSAGISID
jgi:hypothetical protein